ncbi:MAG TPA: 30S ribosomal protein S14 [Chitinophagales bacterium]|nr:30S ribosomal protein S14 [Chitinophagales bacterium]MCB9075707.1 30S ribosomal protein S14 [Chitinophagales bacterium]HMU98089.1 30S ribosomal protein S14 [Chitinophagales bacterium]HMV03258.1 30S ribosomal protein S14 [Chitinophagales bacterium]HMW95110.1 30S ribosomal protein S14 [Chitinophagales bacterium]
MAKESMKARDAKRAKLIAKYKEKREQLKKEGNWEELDKLPKNSSPVRYRKRCKITGRPRGYVGFFGISRIKFRDLANEGKIPGLTKASW